VASGGVEVRRRAQLRELELDRHRRRAELRGGQRERLHAQGVTRAHAQELALHAVERDGALLHVVVGLAEEHEVAQLRVRHERCVRGVDERRVRQRQVLARAVRDAQHRHRARGGDERAGSKCEDEQKKCPRHARSFRSSFFHLLQRPAADRPGAGPGARISVLDAANHVAR